MAGCDRERAVALYYAVRDGIRYDPYRIDLSVPGMRASTTLAHGYGWCVPKATLLAAACGSQRGLRRIMRVATPAWSEGHRPFGVLSATSSPTTSALTPRTTGPP